MRQGKQESAKEGAKEVGICCRNTLYSRKLPAQGPWDY